MNRSVFNLTFGRPETPEQAIIRLPERTHPLYEKDKVFEHLVHVKEWFIQTYINILNGYWSRLENRFAPLTVEDMVFMRQISFVTGKPLITADWKSLPESSPWEELFPTGYDQYRWW